MRRILTTLHRWFGLLSALFLCIAGLTGALIAWDHELDSLLNPTFYRAARPSPPLEAAAALALADRLEHADPRLQTRYLPLHAEPNHTLLVSVEGRPNPATGVAYPLDFNQLALDPSSGEVQARRMWGEISLARENLLPFLYKLHYSMHLPDGFGFEWGVLFMGAVALVWVLDCFIALWISFPSRKVWRRSLRFRFADGGAKLNFDLHRSGGVWTWLLVLVIAITAVSMNLGDQVVRPVVSLFSKLTPSPTEGLPEAANDKPRAPLMSRATVLAQAQAEAARRGWHKPAGGVFFDAGHGIYSIGFFEPGHDHGDGGLGNAYLYYRSDDGQLIGAQVPGEGSAGDIFLQAQFPLHSGRILGVPGRILITLLGLGVALLSITGVLIWARRRRAKANASAAAASSSRPLATSSSPGPSLNS